MKKLYGVVHLAALPGSPGASETLAEIEERALADADAYGAAGFGGLVVENYGDAPFLPGAAGPETIACMVRLASAIRAAHPGLALGINVLRNDGEAALAVAAATGADFIRVNVLAGVAGTDQGTIEGRAAQILRLRRRLGAEVEIFADVDVKHAVMLSHTDPLHQAEDLVERAGAQTLIVSGRSTGSEPDPALIARLRKRFGDFPLLLGSGLNIKNAASLLADADGAIVGSSVKEGGIADNRVDAQAALRLVEKVAKIEE